MAKPIVYRGNRIQATDQGGQPRLVINDVEVPVRTEPDATFACDFAYPSNRSLLDLGRQVVDQQLALAKPSLEGLADES